MQIMKEISNIGLALYLEKQNSLVLGDVHIGYEEELNKHGFLIPRHHFKDVVNSLDKIFRQLPKLKNIIINGDLKHAFGSISDQEWREILKFLDLLAKHCEKIVVIKGNHDIILGPIAKKRSIEIVDDFNSDGIFICHGHQVPKKKSYKDAKLVIIGNEHPAVCVKDGARSETFKCFLKGIYRKKKMIVMPSFNPITIGTDILKGEFISPFMKTNIAGFEVFVVGDKTYYFGKVKGLE